MFYSVKNKVVAVLFLSIIIIPIISCQKTKKCNTFKHVEKLKRKCNIVALDFGEQVAVAFDYNKNKFVPFMFYKQKNSSSSQFLESNFAETNKMLYVIIGNTLYEFNKTNLKLVQTVDSKVFSLDKYELLFNSIVSFNDNLFIGSIYQGNLYRTVRIDVKDKFKPSISALEDRTIHVFKKYYNAHYDNSNINMINKMYQKIVAAYRSIPKQRGLDQNDYDVKHGWLFSETSVTAKENRDTYNIWWISEGENNKIVKLANGINAYWGIGGWVYYVDMKGNLMRISPKTKTTQIVYANSQNKDVIVGSFHSLITVDKSKQFLFYQYIYKKNSRFSPKLHLNYQTSIVIYDLKKKEFIKCNSKYSLEFVTFLSMP